MNVSEKLYKARRAKGWSKKEAKSTPHKVGVLGIACSKDYARPDLAVAVVEDIVSHSKTVDSFRVLVPDKDPIASCKVLDDTTLRVEFLSTPARIGESPSVGIRKINARMVEESSHLIVFWDGESNARIRDLIIQAKAKGIKIREFIY